MRDIFGDIPIFNRVTNQWEVATLYQDIEQNNIDDFDKHWAPAFDERKPQKMDEKSLIAANIQDFSWEWESKAKTFKERLDYVSYALECNGRTQGFMIIEAGKRRSQLTGFEDKTIVYVEYIATAPWNRFNFTQSPTYKGIGSVLMLAAIHYSQNEGYEGRIGLTALKQSEKWYNDVLKMTDLGVLKNVPNGRYYELTPERAADFAGEIFS